MISIEDCDYKKSTFSQSNGCVEVRRFADGSVGLRDSKDRARDAYIFTTKEWRAFIAGVRNGEFDL